MATGPFFKLSTPSSFDMAYGTLAESVTTIFDGYLVAYSSGSLVVSTGSAIGLACDNFALIEFPTDENLATYFQNRMITYARGFGRAMCGSGLFVTGLPSPGDWVYDNGNGKLTITSAAGKQRVGQAMGHTTQLTAGQVQNDLVEIEFSFFTTPGNV